MPLISVAELIELLAGRGPLADGEPPAPVVVCDVRFDLFDAEKGRRDYDAGHIPGARFVDIDTELSDHSIVGRGRHPLPAPEAFTALLGRLGATPGTHLVGYDAAGGGNAARLWWMARSVGHTRVSVLDGGFPAWAAAGGEVTPQVPAVTPTDYPAAYAWTGIVSADDVAEAVGLGGTVVDSRAADRYRGEHEPLDPRAGHIPGAVNLPFGDNLAPDGTFRSVAELAERFADVGERPIVYCGSGVTACHNLLAMSLANVLEARLFPGSWSEWSSDPTRPVATGEAP